MSNEQTVTTIGRLTNDPELRFTPAGAAVVNFTIATNARTFDKNTNAWKDEPTTFWRCSAWRELAENIAESLVKGDGVIAQGVIKSRSYEKDGQSRTVMEQEVSAIGPDLRWSTAKAQKAARGNGEGGRAPANAGNFGNFGESTNSPTAVSDPWGAPGSNTPAWSANTDAPF